MKWTLTIVMIMIFMLGTALVLSANAAWAGNFVFGQHAKQMAAYDSQMADLKAKTAVAVAASKAAYAWQDKCMAPFKMVAWPLPAVGFAIKALRSPTKDKLEYLGFPSVCRGGNTAKNYGIQNIFGGALDLVTLPFNKTTYAPVLGQPGEMAERTMKRGPITQVLETASYGAPISCVAAGVLAPIAGTSFGGTTAIFGTTLPIAAIPVGVVSGMAEKAAFK